MLKLGRLVAAALLHFPRSHGDVLLMRAAVLALSFFIDLQRRARRVIPNRDLLPPLVSIVIVILAQLLVLLLEARGGEVGDLGRIVLALAPLMQHHVGRVVDVILTVFDDASVCRWVYLRHGNELLVVGHV